MSLFLPNFHLCTELVHLKPNPVALLVPLTPSFNSLLISGLVPNWGIKNGNIASYAKGYLVASSSIEIQISYDGTSTEPTCSFWMVPSACSLPTLASRLLYLCDKPSEVNKHMLPPTVSVNQEFGSGLTGWWWARVPREIAVVMSA